MGDVSGDGFDAILFVEGEILFRYQPWTSVLIEASSNYRELGNLVRSMEKCHLEGKLKGVEIFLLTDNLVSENAFYKKTSSSRTLFELILRLHKLKLEGNMKLCAIHIAGSRLTVSGVEVLSRGETSKGMIEGKDVLSFFPFHTLALEWTRS